MADWSSLLPDLVRRVGHCLLDTSDVDYYTDMRAECHNWRSAMTDPCSPGDGASDLPFRPRHWVILDEDYPKDDADGPRLFLNIRTGRYLRRRVPMLRDHVLVGASDGLLVLRTRNMVPLLAIRVLLNPFTGFVPHFASPIRECIDDAIVAVTGPAPTLVFLIGYIPLGPLGMWPGYEDHTKNEVYLVSRPTSEQCPVNFDGVRFRFQSMASHARHVYVVDKKGSMFRIVGTDKGYYHGELIAKMDSDSDNFLVESAGELLFVRLWWRAVEVYSVDVEQNVLEPVEVIGGRALFLGHRRCLSVDADNLPSIDRNRIYYSATECGINTIEWGPMYMYDLSNHGKKEDIHGGSLNVNDFTLLVCPLSLVQVLLTYCNVLEE